MRLKNKIGKVCRIALFSLKRETECSKDYCLKDSDAFLSDFSWY